MFTYKTFLLLIIFLYFNCVNEIVDTIPPAKPHLLPHAPDTAYGIEGIDAVPDSNWIEIVWVANKESDLSHYLLYRYSFHVGNLNFKYELDKNISTINYSIEATDTLSWIDSGVRVVDSLFRYSYYIFAVDNYGNKSISSDTVDYILIPKVSDAIQVNFIPRGTITNIIDPLFKINMSGSSQKFHSFIIKVMDLKLNKIIWISDILEDRFNPIETPYNDNKRALVDIVKGNEYQWRIDIIGSYGGDSGSETQWILFDTYY